MELLESLLVNKKNVIVLAVIYFIVVIIIFVYIWWPDSSVNIAKYELYDETERNKEKVEYYVRLLDSIKQSNDYDAMEHYVDSNYLTYGDTSITTLLWRLGGTDYAYDINTFDLYKNGNQWIYSVQIPSGDRILKVNFMEYGNPYDFTITFDSFVNYSQSTYSGSLDGVKLNITSIYQDLNYIKYEMSVTNESYDELVLDFSNANNFKLNLTEERTASLNLLHSTLNKVVVKKGSTIPVELVFNVGITEQSNINSLSISKIFNGVSELDATILFEK